MLLDIQSIRHFYVLSPTDIPQKGGKVDKDAVRLKYAPRNIVHLPCAKKVSERNISSRLTPISYHGNKRVGKEDGRSLELESFWMLTWASPAKHLTNNYRSPNGVFSPSCYPLHLFFKLVSLKDTKQSSCFCFP